MRVYLPRTHTMLRGVCSAIIYIIRCDEHGCPDDGMLVVGGSCLLSIGAMVVVGIPMRKSDNRKVDDSALWRTPNPGGTGIERSNAVSLAFSQALLADAGHNRPTIFDAKANHNTYSVANIGFQSPKSNHGCHPNPIRNSKNGLPPPGEGWGGASIPPYPPYHFTPISLSRRSAWPQRSIM